VAQSLARATEKPRTQCPLRGCRMQGRGTLPPSVFQNTATVSISERWSTDRPTPEVRCLKNVQCRWLWVACNPAAASRSAAARWQGEHNRGLRDFREPVTTAAVTENGVKLERGLQFCAPGFRRGLDVQGPWYQLKIKTAPSKNEFPRQHPYSTNVGQRAINHPAEHTDVRGVPIWRRRPRESSKQDDSPCSPSD